MVLGADIGLIIVEVKDWSVEGIHQAILIDEAQDFAPAWFRVAFGMLKPETNLLFMAGDGAQRIYRRDFTWKELGLTIFAQNSYILKRSYRSTREIIDVALEVIRDSQTLLADMEQAGDSLLEPEPHHADVRHGPLPVLLTFKSPENEYAAIAGEIRSILQQGYLAQDIIILLRHRDQAEPVLQELRQHGIAGRLVKGELDLAEAAVKVCTVHSAKGLEFEIVFICGLEQFKIDEPVETQGD